MVLNSDLWLTLSQNTDKTTREKLIEIFLSNPGVEFSLQDLLRLLSLREKDSKRLLNDINHIAKTIRRMTNNSAYLAMRPPKCLNCGYTFSNLESAKRPSRCPKCKSERITEPTFVLLGKES